MMSIRKFPGGPVVRTLCFHCQGCEFDSWLVWPKKKKKGKKMTNINLNNKCNSVGKMESREICVWCGYAVLNSKTLSPP